VLVRLDLSAEDRDKIVAQVEARLKCPTEADFQAEQAELERHERGLGVLSRLDEFVALVSAWTAANQSERARFIAELRKTGVARARAARSRWASFEASSTYWEVACHRCDRRGRLGWSRIGAPAPLPPPGQ
jgi:hypothetical protein